MKKSFRKRKYSKKRYKTDKKRGKYTKRKNAKRKNKKKTLRLTGGSRGSQTWRAAAFDAEQRATEEAMKAQATQQQLEAERFEKEAAIARAKEDAAQREERAQKLREQIQADADELIRHGEELSKDKLIDTVSQELGPIAMYEMMYNEMCDYKNGGRNYNDYMEVKQPIDFNSERDNSEFKMLWDSIPRDCKKIHIFTNTSNVFDPEGHTLKKIVRDLEGYRWRLGLGADISAVDTGSYESALYNSNGIPKYEFVRIYDDGQAEVERATEEKAAAAARAAAAEAQATEEIAAAFAGAEAEVTEEKAAAARAAAAGAEAVEAGAAFSQFVNEARGTLTEYPMKYLFTRHAQSCNNTTKNPFNKLMDPQITLEGIRTAYESSKTTKRSVDTAEEGASYLYDSDIVYVSCLVRTWMTALLLYNGHRTQPRKIFTLRVIPFIKEKLKYGVDRGNMPTELMYSISSFLLFLNKLNDIRDNEGMEEWMDNIPDLIYVEIYVPGSIEGTFDKHSIVFNKMRGRGEKFGFIYNLNCPEKRTLEILENHFNNANGIFRLEGDIQRCMRSGILEDTSGTNMIHIVSHNEVMQEFLNGFIGNSFRKIVRHDESGGLEPAPEEETQSPLVRGELEILSSSYLKSVGKQNIYSFELGKSELPEVLALKNKYYIKMGEVIPEQQSVGGVYLNTIYEGYVSEGGTFSLNKEQGICIEIPPGKILTCP